MNYREEIETALHRDGKQYGKVWRGETEGMSEADINPCTTCTSSPYSSL